LGTATRLLGQMKLLLDAQEDLLTAVPGSIAPGTPKFLQLRTTRISMFTIHQGCTSLLTYMSYALLIELWSIRSGAAGQVHKRRIQPGPLERQRCKATRRTIV
jgi:hypothetical protein